MDLGTRIASWRKAKGMTQRQLAEACDVTVSAVSYWEGGDKQTSPSVKTLDKIIAAFKLTPAEFYGTVPKPKKKNATPKRAVA